MRRLLLIIFLFPLLFIGCVSKTKQDITTPFVVHTADVLVDTVANRRAFITTIGSNYEAVIQPRVSGFLAAKLFSNGMPVKKGDVIFRLDGREQQTALLAAKASLESATANYIEAKNNYARAVPLASIDAISQAQLDQYTAQYSAAQASVKSAEQNLANAQLGLDYTTIYASIDGVISSSDAHVGDYVGPGTQFTTLTRIQNIDTVCVELAVPMRQYIEYSGRKSFTYDNDRLLSDIVLYLVDGSRYNYLGSYSYTKSSVSDSAGTIILVVAFPNPDYLLKSGQFARVETNIGPKIPRVTIPSSAVQQVQDVNFVWVIRPDSTAEYRKVEVGNIADGRIEVISGLDGGERVAVNGASKLSNNQKVKL